VKHERNKIDFVFCAMWPGDHWRHHHHDQNTQAWKLHGRTKTTEVMTTQQIMDKFVTGYQQSFGHPPGHDQLASAFKFISVFFHTAIAAAPGWVTPGSWLLSVISEQDPVIIAERLAGKSKPGPPAEAAEWFKP
jgi:hypothetical protein